MLRWAATLAVVAFAAAGVPAQRQEVLVSGAASLADVLETIADAYESRTGVRVAVNTGASNTLARQIAAFEPSYIDWVAGTVTRDPSLVAAARVIQADLDARGVPRRAHPSPARPTRSA